MCNECGPHECVCDFEKSLKNMPLNDAYNILKLHNGWRRGDNMPMGNVTELGRAIDIILEYVEKDLKCQ